MKRTRRGSALAANAIVGAAVALVAAAGFGFTAPAATPPMKAVAAADFTITSFITDWPSCSGSPALFYPGVTRCIVYTVGNRLASPITVTAIDLALDRGAGLPSGCRLTDDLDVSDARFSGSLDVGAAPATASTPGLPIRMLDVGNQDACQGVSFHLTLSGIGQYSGSSTGSTPQGGVLGSSITVPATGAAVSGLEWAVRASALVAAGLLLILAGKLRRRDEGGRASALDATGQDSSSPSGHG